MRHIRIALLALGLAPVAASASDFPYPLGTTPDQERFHPTRQAVAVLPDGGYAAVWTSWTPPGGPAAVHMQWLRPDGTRVFPEGGVQVSSKATWGDQAVVVSHPESGVYVAYVRYGERGTRVHAQWYDGKGRRRWPDEAVGVAPVSAREDQMLPHLVADAGGLFVCFMRNLPFTRVPYSEIGCQRLSPEGRRLWTNRGHKAGGVPGWRGAPRAVTDARGGILVFWLNLRSPGERPRQLLLIEGQRFSPAGERLWGTGKVVHRTGVVEGGVLHPLPFEAVPDGEEGALLAFEDRLDRSLPIDVDVVAQRVDRNGRLLWGKGTAVASGPAAQFFDTLVHGPGGGAFVVAQAPGDGATRITLHRLDGDGRLLWNVDLATEPVNFGGSGLDAHLHFHPVLGLLSVLWEHHPSPQPNRSEARLDIFELDGSRRNQGSMTAQSNWVRPRGIAYDDGRELGLAVWETAYDNGDENTAGALFGVH